MFPFLEATKEKENGGRGQRENMHLGDRQAVEEGNFCYVTETGMSDSGSQILGVRIKGPILPNVPSLSEPRQQDMH